MTEKVSSNLTGTYGSVYFGIFEIIFKVLPSLDVYKRQHMADAFRGVAADDPSYLLGGQ